MKLLEHKSYNKFIKSTKCMKQFIKNLNIFSLKVKRMDGYKINYVAKD